MHVKNLTDSYLELTKKTSSSLITTLIDIRGTFLLLAKKRGVKDKDMVMVMVLSEMLSATGSDTVSATLSENF